MGKDKKAKGGESSKAASSLPPHIELQSKNVICGPDKNHHVSTVTSATAYLPLGIDNSWDLDVFKDNFDIKIIRSEENVMEFEMIGIDPAVANALRRILIAEIPTIAIEHIFMINNTSIIQDEVLSHRLGLIPIKMDPSILEQRSSEEAASEKNTVIFKLDITCKKSGDKMLNEKVMSGDFKWLPNGSEIPDESGARFASSQQSLGEAAPSMVHDDILVAKLRPGQSIVLEAHCIKGIGKEHAKWSPVSTAWYRLYPEIKIIKEASDEVAKELVEAAPGLFFIDPRSGKLCMAEARKHEKLIEKVRTMQEREEIAQCIQVLKRKDHFIFTIESTGIIPPKDLLIQAIEILQVKASSLIEKL